MNEFFPSDTLRSRGYHMTEKDVQAEQDAAVGRYMRLRQNAEAARERLQRAGKQMRDVAAVIQGRIASEVASFKFEPFEWFNLEAVKRLAEDEIRAENEVMDAREKAVRLGASLSGIL